MPWMSSLTGVVACKGSEDDLITLAQIDLDIHSSDKKSKLACRICASSKIWVVPVFFMAQKRRPTKGRDISYPCKGTYDLHSRGQSVNTGKSQHSQFDMFLWQLKCLQRQSLETCCMGLTMASPQMYQTWEFTNVISYFALESMSQIQY